MTTALVHSEEWGRFDYGPQHPLRMERLGLTWRLMQAYGLTRLPDNVLYFLALTLNSLIAFALLYGLAIYHRREPLVHARYMVATVFPLFTPVTDRLIGAHAPAIVELVPRIAGAPVLPVAGFVLAHAMLVGLAVWDWAANRRLDVFPVALAIVAAYHVSVLTFHEVPFWQDFGLWFLRLPLS